MVIGKRDTVDMGTDGRKGLSAKIYVGKDSLVIPYTNLPYGQTHYIPIQSSSAKTVFRLRFNGITASFSPSYMKKNSGNVTFEVPEVYELANIIWTLSPSGQRATDLNKEGSYYEKVLNHFKPYRDHPIFNHLNFSDSLYGEKYYDFRENSFTFNFQGDKLVYDGPYYYVMGDEWDNFNSLFRMLLPDIEDFARKSKYREFYRRNQRFYQREIERQQQLMPLRNMWNWLEEEFPGRNYHSYKIIFSPLIGGSHSTQNFWTFNTTTYKWFAEIVMFVCGPGMYDKQQLSEKQKQGLLSGIVFTEIDHNYVNPVSYKFSETIDSIFSKRDIWAGSGTSWYNNPVSVFNEYMTHSLFCLWVLDNYDKEIADFVITKREALMVERRKFSKFREFNRSLIELRQKNKSIKVVDLYPAIIEWCRNQI